MNIISKILCAVGLLGAVGGGITLGVGACQGGNFKRGVIEDESNLNIHADSFDVSEMPSSINIDMSVGDIRLYTSTNDRLTITHKTYEKQNTISISGSTVYVKSKGDNPFNWSLTNMFSKYMGGSNSLSIFVPDWYSNRININLGAGKIRSEVYFLTPILDFKNSAGSIEIVNAIQTNKMKLEASAGDIDMNLEDLRDITEIDYVTYDLKVSAGSINVKMPDNDLTYYVDADVSVGNRVVEGDGVKEDSKIRINADVTAGNIKITK
ncbi:MAG TPA: hypothetical protein DCY93_01815 [Firmicutes bacterium]|nr:hypothetical protein [Bacillota bacterium]